VRVLGRRDSQVSVGGLKVDLTEVEHTLAALPEVANVVVIHDHAIEAYLVLTEGAELPAVERQVTTRLAPYKRPRRLHVVEQLPRTATGKLVRSQAALRDVTPGRPGQPHPSASAEPLP
jgi:3-hydroxy-4-methylanthranilate adenylyltransferase